MKMNKKYYLISILLLWALSSMTMCFAASDPVGELSSIADQLINKLKQHKTSLKENPAMVYSFANQIIVPHADVAEMSKRVLPPATWKSATPKQRSQFQKEFTTLLVHTYASALANYKDQTVQFYPVRGGYQGKSTVQVRSEIERPDGPSIPVSYRLVMKGSQWKVFDISVEGVSMLESFRSQFSDLLAQGDMGKLIQQLAQHNTKSVGNNE